MNGHLKHVPPSIVRFVGGDDFGSGSLSPASDRGVSNGPHDSSDYQRH